MPGIKVVAGSADQPAQSMGYGVYNPGKALVTIATGGQVIHSSLHAQTDPQMRVYVFNHAVPEHWYAHAAILSAGLSLRWLRDLLGMRNVLDAYQHLSQMAAEVPAGAEGLLFLPYLAGNRTPHMDSSANGVFVGLRLHHGAKHMVRAVMEGVAFAMHDCLELIAGLNGNVWPQVIASGGATRSPVWRQIQADVYNVPLTLAPDANYACIGAALLAGIGSKVYASLDEACARAPKFTTTLTPNADNAALYQSRREVYRALYDDLKEHMHTLADNP
jgi:xylulokinase